MARKNGAAIDEKQLTKGQLRKLNALRKSIGPDIAERAFVEWLESQPTAEGTNDPGAEMIASSLWELVEKDEIQIPRGGYLVRRGRGRVIVERANSD